ncbi:MAG: hypothetical protein JW787_14985 [Sedimentisphaerales bacterium]|nr:hypothetical protein [Sedimentisphaerales bacterium]
MSDKKLYHIVIPKLIKEIVTIFLIIIFVISLSLWLFINIQQPSASRKPAVAIQSRFALSQVCARNDGIHFLVTESRGRQLLKVHFKHVNYMGNDGYRWGHVINLLALVIAISPTGTGGIDYIVSPYMAIAIPYWFLISGTGFLLVKLTSISRWIAPYCRPTKISASAGVIIILIFILLNIVPFAAWRPGSKIQPQSISEWMILTFSPKSAYSDVMLVYGFPFSCYKKGYIDGQPVNLYYGASVGWKSYKVMENLCIALFSIFVTMCVVKWLHMVTRKNSKYHEFGTFEAKSVIK